MDGFVFSALQRGREVAGEGDEWWAHDLQLSSHAAYMLVFICTSLECNYRLQARPDLTLLLKFEETDPVSPKNGNQGPRVVMCGAEEIELCPASIVLLIHPNRGSGFKI